MATYEIEWTVLDFLEALREGFDKVYDLYYIAENGRRRWEVLYIGMVQKQSVSDRLLNNHEGLKTALSDFKKRIYIGLGDILKKKLSDEEIEYIELALISHHKPRLNSAGVKRYKGSTIRIENYKSTNSDFDLDLDEKIEFD